MIKPLIRFSTERPADLPDDEDPDQVSEVLEAFFQSDKAAGISAALQAQTLAAIDELDSLCVRFHGNIVENDDPAGKWPMVTITTENDVTMVLHTRFKFQQGPSHEL